MSPVLLVTLCLLCGNLASHADPQNGTLTRNHLKAETRQGRGCTYSHTFSNVGEYLYLQSESYPNDYPPNLNCRYTLESPRATQIRLECPSSDFNVEPSQNCQYDKFFWSLSGDDGFRDWIYTCGSRDIHQTSNGQRLTIGFQSDQGNPGSSRPWRYRCKLSVVPTPCGSNQAGSPPSCGLSGASNRIVGGSEAEIAEFPWRVALYVQSTGLFCGAALISPSWILTAAHCTTDKEGETIYADIGDHDVTDERESPNQIIAVDRILQNSMYDERNQDSDTALLHLSQPVEFNRYIQPLCLPWRFTSRDFQNAVGTASGWGTTSFGGKQSEVLRKVHLDIMNQPNCKKAWEGRLEITQNMICAARDGQDTCQSDSGGTLDYLESESGRYYGVGIVSFGVGCAEKGNPGVYVQLVNFLGWIEQNSGETFCKA